MPGSNEGQFGVVRILRPFSGFEDVYGSLLAATVPLMLTEVDPSQGPGGQPLDPMAGQSGYDPSLVRGISTPIGARVLLWLPRFQPQGLTTGITYQWRFIWRLRNTRDYRTSRIPYHYPKQGEGAPDGADPRVVLPAAYETVDYNQTEVSTNAATTVQHALREDFSFLQGPIIFEIPVVPDGSNGQIQQGVTSTANAPSYLVHETMAKGDELLIGFSRPADTEPLWEFALDAADGPVSTLLGEGAASGPFPDVGVYIMTGAAG